MPARARKTEIASLLEEFLDENEESLPPVMFSVLDDLAEQIDNQVSEKDTEIDDLKSDMDELKDQIEKLEDELEEME